MSTPSILSLSVCLLRHDVSNRLLFWTTARSLLPIFLPRPRDPIALPLFWPLLLTVGGTDAVS